MSKRILILANHDVGLYNFRKELLERLLAEGHEVFVSCPQGDNIEKIINMGCNYIETEFNRHGMNPLNEVKLLNHYKEIMREINPDIVFGYTIKPNIYGSLAAKKYDIPFVANITGLGTAVETPGFLQKVIIRMYKNAFSDIQTVFFQNKENRQFFIDNNIAVDKHKMIPGSGVNLEHFYLQEYPSTGNSMDFVFISRIMKEKGIDQYLEAAEYITNKYPDTKFHICGFCEDAYEEILVDYQDRGIVEYHGMVSDVREILKSSHCTIHPTYYPEGLSNVLLESAASGRPIISTDRSGTRETIDHGVNGYLIEEKNTKDLIEKLEKFIRISYVEKQRMGIRGREKVENEFDRQIVIDKYINELSIASGGE
ncbi:glycosyltransferase family 4 protein [Ruoffia tabacinasalis]|uniref:glycosyltransferase family 4 protein n=1 Tax=Ruoffia tabacinasalis TaxID=87458 RepID=UPI0030CDDD99